jgi:hypothetical protein
MDSEYYQQISELKKSLAEYDYDYVLNVAESLLDIVYAFDTYNKALEKRIQSDRLKAGELCKIVDELLTRGNNLKSNSLRPDDTHQPKYNPAIVVATPYKKTRRGKRGGRKVREQELRKLARNGMVPGEVLYDNEEPDNIPGETIYSIMDEID